MYLFSDGTQRCTHAYRKIIAIVGINCAGMFVWNYVQESPHSTHMIKPTLYTHTLSCAAHIQHTCRLRKLVVVMLRAVIRSDDPRLRRLMSLPSDAESRTSIGACRYDRRLQPTNRTRDRSITYARTKLLCAPPPNSQGTPFCRAARVT